MRLFKKKPEPTTVKEILMNVTDIFIVKDGKRQRVNGTVEALKFTPDGSVEIHVRSK